MTRVIWPERRILTFVVARWVVAVGVIALLVALPAPARAGTVSVLPDPKHPNVSYFRYAAALGERNDVKITVAADDLTATLSDATAPVAVTGSCVLVSAHTARCEPAPSPTWAYGPYPLMLDRIDLGDRDDELHVVAGPLYGADVLADGGLGDDLLVGGARSDTLRGGGGHDQLVGGPGDDVLADGDRDNDELGGPRADADIFVGGSGNDTVSYADRTKSVAVDLGQRGPDGALGEDGDALRDIESITGGHGDDRLIGNEKRNHLLGGPGRDRLVGRGGGDRLDGGPRRDRLIGGGGDDEMNVSAGDSVACGDGHETISGTPTASTFLQSCEELWLWHRLHRDDVGSARMALVPHGSTVSRLRYQVGWFDLWSRVSGKVTWREANGRHRVLAVTTLDVPSEEGGSLPVRLTALGRQMMSSRHGVRATARLRATILERKTWTTVIKVPSRAPLRP